jgi:predicted DNA-binding protein
VITTEDGEEISAADHAAGIVEGTGKTEYRGITKVISVRLPLHLAIQLQALAQKSGRTRNATVATLLEVGLEEVRMRLSDETAQELQEIEIELHNDEFGHQEEEA